ncbi:MAG: response regulator [Desulfobacterales bacterium]|nr:response regulator [Desulfobacterales bacterium]
MDTAHALDRKQILVVDDEPDILETLEELLHTSRVKTAATFDQAVDLLKTHPFDAAVLDIMGVRGFEILKITRQLKIPTLMLTAHALTPENMRHSMEKGADAYVPKDKITDIPLFIADVLAARREGKEAHAAWYEFLTPAFDRVFGKGWRKSDADFWDEFEQRKQK